MEENNNSTLVSVIIPTYGGRKRLVNSVKSVLSQTYTNLEVIVIDDNPPESENRRKTESMMNEVDDSRVKYIRHPQNKNGAAARNTGITASHGEFIAFLDDDDCFLPDKLALQIKYLNAHTEYQAVYCLASKEGKPILTTPYEGDVSLPLLMGKSNMFTPTLLFHRCSLEYLNGFDENYCRHQDYELLLRFFASGFKIGCLEKILTDLGRNEGENSPHGEKLEQLKAIFLENFSNTINNFEITNPGVKNKIFAVHYSKVFVDHIKTHHWKMAFKTLKCYWHCSPKIFISQIYKTALHVIFQK